MKKIFILAFLLAFMSLACGLIARSGASAVEESWLGLALVSLLSGAAAAGLALWGTVWLLASKLKD